MKKYQACLFDFDYTLVDSHIGILKCYRIVLNRHGYTHVTDDAIKHTIGKTLEASFSIMTGITDEDKLIALRKEYVIEANTYMTPNTFLFPDTVSTLHQLKQEAYKLGIISTKYRYRFMELMNKHFPADFFDVLIGNEDVIQPKPHPEGIYNAIKQMQLQPEDVVYIGDSPVDGETAQKANIAFVGVTTGTTTACELSAYPHLAIISALRELPQTLQGHITQQTTTSR